MLKTLNIETSAKIKNLFRTMCALDAKLADQNGAKRSFELAISHKQLLCDVREPERQRSRGLRMAAAGKRAHYAKSAWPLQWSDSGTEKVASVFCITFQYMRCLSVV